MTEEKPLRFDRARLQEELRVLPELAEKFLEGGDHRVHAARDQIKAASLYPDREFTWQIPEAEPIRTTPSAGEYEIRNDGSREKGVPVIGLLSFVWEMRTDPGKSFKYVNLTGNASTKIRLLNAKDQSELAMWRMEIGAEDAPGCCFHTQVLGEHCSPPFPKSMPVPRLPSYPPTPMACLEFLLSELFQVRWREEIIRQNRQTRGWRKIQKDRLTAFFDWQQGVLRAATVGSPLLSLKGFPDADQLAL